MSWRSTDSKVKGTGEMQLHDDKQTNRADNIQGAEIRLPSADLTADLAFFMKTLGFRMDKIYPADYPTISVLSGHGLTIRLEQDAPEPPGTLRILCRDPAALAGGQTELTAPNGTRIEIVQGRSAAGDSTDATRLPRAEAEGQHPLGDRPRGHALPRPGARPPGREHHRLSHPDPRRRARSRRRALPHRGIPADLRLSGAR